MIAQACPIGSVFWAAWLFEETFMMVSLYIYHTGKYNEQPIKLFSKLRFLRFYLSDMHNRFLGSEDHLT